MMAVRKIDETSQAKSRLTGVYEAVYLVRALARPSAARLPPNICVCLSAGRTGNVTFTLSLPPHYCRKIWAKYYHEIPDFFLCSVSILRAMEASCVCSPPMMKFWRTTAELPVNSCTRQSWGHSWVREMLLHRDSAYIRPVRPTAFPSPPRRLYGCTSDQKETRLPERPAGVRRPTTKKKKSNCNPWSHLMIGASLIFTNGRGKSSLL